MARVLVTGATGFIGSHLVEKLVSAGHEVRCLVRKTSNLQWLPRERVRLFTSGGFQPEDYRPALQAVAVVYHLAGATKARSLDEYQKHNVTLTRHLLEAVKRFAPSLQRLVMVSSQAAAGPAAPGETADESAVCRPVTYYGESKLAAERLLSLYPGIPAVVLRPVSVYGPRDRDVLSIVKMIGRGFAPVIGSPDRRLTFVFVEDVVRAMLLVAEDARAVGRTYFVTDGRVYSWREMRAIMERVLRRRSLAVRVPAPFVWMLAAGSETWSRLTGRATIFNFNKVHELLQVNWGCSGERLQRELGFTPKYDLEQGLRLTVAWARQAGWL